ncbi:hypothetical protein BGX31_006060, partial [Mortierella sp. GBA43]
FSDSGDYSTAESAPLCAQQLLEDGAGIIDTGGMPTCPNAPEFTGEEEIHRVVPVIQLPSACGFNAPISVNMYMYTAPVTNKAIEA